MRLRTKRGVQIILVAVGTLGDILPAVGVGRLLAALEYEVRVLANPVFSKVILDGGLDCEPVGREQDFWAMVRKDDFWDFERCFDSFLKGEVIPNLRTTGAIIQRLAASAPSVVVAFQYAYGAIMSSRKLGLPAVQVVLTPAALSFQGMYGRRTRMATELIVNSVTPVSAQKYKELPMIGLFPDWFPILENSGTDVIRTGFPLYNSGSELDPQILSFLNAGAPPIVAFVGSNHPRANLALKIIKNAIRITGRRAILITTDQSVESEMNMLLVPHAPFRTLFPRAAAVIHHGGIGTIAECLVAGVPQMALPFAFEAHDNASAMTRLGVGCALAFNLVEASVIAARLGDLLVNLGVREACRSAKILMSSENPFDVTGDTISSLINRSNSWQRSAIV
jgi:rhamnosyltransferase subunit B